MIIVSVFIVFYSIMVVGVLIIVMFGVSGIIVSLILVSVRYNVGVSV